MNFIPLIQPTYSLICLPILKLMRINDLKYLYNGHFSLFYYHNRTLKLFVLQYIPHNKFSTIFQRLHFLILTYSTLKLHISITIHPPHLIAMAIPKIGYER